MQVVLKSIYISLFALICCTFCTYVLQVHTKKNDEQLRSHQASFKLYSHVSVLSLVFFFPCHFRSRLVQKEIQKGAARFPEA